MIRRFSLIAIAWLLFCAVFPLHADEEPIFARVREVLAETLGVDAEAITPDSSLTGLGMNEKNKSEVKRNLEVQFGIMIPQDTFDQMSRVADVVRFFRERLNQ